MAVDKSRKDKRDRNRVAGDEDYEIDYLTQKTGSIEAPCSTCGGDEKSDCTAVPLILLQGRCHAWQFPSRRRPSTAGH
jgi:hypothetical protein